MMLAVSREDRARIEAGEKVVENVSLEQVSAFPNLESFLPVPLYSLVRFGRWNEILERPKNERPYLLLVAGFPAQDATVPNIGRYDLTDIATFVE